MVEHMRCQGRCGKCCDPTIGQFNLRALIAAQIAAFADDHSDVSDAYRHAALIATQGATE